MKLSPLEDWSSLWTKYLDPYPSISRINKRLYKDYFKPITDLDIERALAIILEYDRLLPEIGFEFEVFVYDIQGHILDGFGGYVRHEKTLDILRKAEIKMPSSVMQLVILMKI